MNKNKKSYREAFFSKRQFNSDKWDHYFEIYDHLFGHLYNSKITYVEIGVQNGGSLEIAKKLFSSDSVIVGVDIDPLCKNLETDGVASHIIIGSQTNDDCLKQIISKVSNIDIIIDDGSHVQYDVIKSFIELFPYLKENGIYIIEDTHTIYSPEHQKSFYGIGLYDYFKGLSERLNIDYIDPSLRKSRYKIPREKRIPIKKFYDIIQEIFSIEFFDSIIAIRKKAKLEPLRIIK
jgi:23S rRNA U2552 (ribose-2'-O)-methylase RlmE/FtsJ